MEGQNLSSYKSGFDRPEDYYSNVWHRRGFAA